MVLSGQRRTAARVMLIVAMVGISGCADWRGLNSLPLPGTQGSGPGSFVVQAQMPMSTICNRTRGCGSPT